MLFGIKFCTKKCPRIRLSTSPSSGAEGLQISVHLKSYNVQKWKIPLALILGEINICAH